MSRPVSRFHVWHFQSLHFTNKLYQSQTDTKRLKKKEKQCKFTNRRV